MNVAKEGLSRRSNQAMDVAKEDLSRRSNEAMDVAKEDTSYHLRSGRAFAVPGQGIEARIAASASPKKIAATL
jgi:hypothetical protein